MQEENYQNLLSGLVEYDSLVRGEARHSREYLEAMLNYWSKVGKGSIDELLWSMGEKFPEDKHGQIKYRKAAELIHNTLAFPVYTPLINGVLQSSEKLKSDITSCGKRFEVLNPDLEINNSSSISA